ncbi:MAG: molybdenum cofactor guanylyltransferase [Spirochaetia bacterium]|jgi:molybdopterin-guanine dinucleotide biosynthesis protein A|nr:molybdenum cofactor guanylyltransferase [Spirochaetia bacterium]
MAQERLLWYVMIHVTLILTGGKSVLQGLSLAILAGGMGRRFGGSDKQAVPLGGVPLGRKVALNALSTELPVYLIGPSRTIYDGLPLRFVRDTVPGFGPLSGLHAALSSAATPWLYLLACDMPFFNKNWLHYLSCLLEDSSAEEASAPLAILARRGKYIEPFQGLYSRFLIPELERKMDSASAAGAKLSFSRLLDDLPHRIVPEAVARNFSPDWSLFKSINDPSALREFQ